MPNSKHNEAHHSVWIAHLRKRRHFSLTDDLRADVCIVGAGISGLSVAYHLGRLGKEVVVVDSDPLAAGQTARTTAHLSNAIDDRYQEIERLHGADGARLAAESHTAAIDRIESIVKAEAIECDFQRVDGYLMTGPGQSIDILEAELAAAHRAGLPEVEMLDGWPVAGFDSGPVLRFPRQAQFHPLRYLRGLTRAIERDGGRVLLGNHVESIEPGPPAVVSARNGHTITADAVVVATNTPINDRFSIHAKQAPYLSYVIATRIEPGRVPKALYWDTLDPYHYVRVHPVRSWQDRRPAYDLLIVGGEDHKTAQAFDAPQRYERLETWARERFPALGAVEFRWSGQIMETIDGLAFIGRNPGDAEHIFIVTGDSGMGMTHGTIAGMLLPDLIMRRENRWAELYDPARRTLGAALEFARENINVAAQYASWVTGSEVTTADELEPGSGAVIRRGLSKVAVFRDLAGNLHEMSAACPHLGCVVAWNADEHCWDCPCHGSRFDRLGHCLTGPANADLAHINVAAHENSRG
ncbi:MAG TPA: FAD-dependent oxidoreductase [Pirellulales bacterium]|jgi:glycine/D-amino acid oxidase-like deaminating enzyme/nitrite reductase/ring-hydroxylating ferredoxin subunit|nr:FAD-dependent oxidoreductase [Pirellulales bacterium]